MRYRLFIRQVGRALIRVLLVEILCVGLLAIPTFIEETETRVLPATITRGRSLDEVELKLTLVAKVLRPTAMAIRNRDDKMYVASKRGVIFALGEGQPRPTIDLSDEVGGGFEQGVLGLAFTPDSRLMLVNFTNRNNDSITRSYRFKRGRPDPKSGKDLFVVPKPTAVHNAGNLVFGPDDYLYLTLGDGGQQADPTGVAQSLSTPLGKVLRIEVLPDQTYQIPSDNPFVGKKGARGEIWAYGLRNPWRFSFDRVTGDLWIADVGFNDWEEINVERFGEGGGLNYGWSRLEGRRPLRNREPPPNHVLPVFTYPHADGVCSITGGFVYRGTKIDGLDGSFLFSDFCKGGVEAIRVEGERTAEHREFDVDVTQVTSFGQDADGELYVMSLTEGAVYRIDPE